MPCEQHFKLRKRCSDPDEQKYDSYRELMNASRVQNTQMSWLRDSVAKAECCVLKR